MREHMRSVLLLAALAAVPATLGSAARAVGGRVHVTTPRAAVRCIATEPTLSSFPLGAVEAEFRRKRAGASMYPHKVEVLQAMEPFVEQHLNILKTVDESWQPQDFLPDMRREDWREKIAELRAECQEIPDALLVAIVGDTVTEEALPTYQTLLNTFEGMEDPTGTSQSPWARWSRGWTAEENRHGDILNKFLYLTGRIDMRAMEVTVHNLIKDGFNPSGEKDPYRGIIYTSFQERATKISHQNVARLCGEAGAKKLAILTTRIAGDEARCARWGRPSARLARGSSHGLPPRRLRRSSGFGGGGDVAFQTGAAKTGVPDSRHPISAEKADKPVPPTGQRSALALACISSLTQAVLSAAPRFYRLPRRAAAATCSAALRRMPPLLTKPWRSDSLASRVPPAPVPRLRRRHEMAYQAFMKEIFRLDPSNAMISFNEMMKAQVRAAARTRPASRRDQSDARRCVAKRHCSTPCHIDQRGSAARCAAPCREPRVATPAPLLPSPAPMATTSLARRLMWPLLPHAPPSSRPPPSVPLPDLACTRRS